MTQTLGRLRPLTVGDVMTTTVVSVRESATFHEMVGLMKEHGVSALPVLGADGRLAGIVSEADLLLKEAPPAEPSPARLWPESHEDHIARAKSRGVSAAEIMTRRVFTVRAHSTLSAAAGLMQKHRVKRLPVVDDHGALIGVASRRDLLSVFIRSDEHIRGDIVDRVLTDWLGIAPGTVTVSVAGGVVNLRGSVDRLSDVEVVKHVVASLDGVVRVDVALSHQFDDRHLTSSREGHIS